MRAALKLIVGLIVVPCAIAAMFFWLAGDDSGLASEIEGWAQLAPFVLVPVVISAGLLGVAASDARRRRRSRSDG